MPTEISLIGKDVLVPSSLVRKTWYRFDLFEALQRPLVLPLCDNPVDFATYIFEIPWA